ncbi:AcrR family transcriptional regulator [Kibdelosporangium banguiense]|uniref:AcrR family transcriptional regulator n=1 Tax=Kibdelosporangium banguiense TaxID=1365924 RepID=A0ABS4TTQ3_9PSEU|nr:TetR/AcrR family transcriptional regulator [Kibdelosporangium banguiense]MBP2327350.1 AcrR family transcriptional regulator [Kibdelosporangium banguiense]
MAGRPRATGESAGDRDSRQDLLDAAAELFIEHGFTATSTRAVADRAGLRQASLYHYFNGKEDILAVLLEGTVRPSLHTAHALIETPVPPLAKLWALCRFDLALLCGGPHNLGVLYLRPEIQSPRFAGFHAERAELRDRYRRLVLDSGADELAADLVFGMVEGVVLTRQWKTIPDVESFASAGADAGVRIAGGTDVAAVREQARVIAHLWQ